MSLLVAVLDFVGATRGRAHAGQRELELDEIVASVILAPTTVWLVQHGEKSAELPDPGLTDVGRRQAAAVATLLRQYDIGNVVASPARRARETAAMIAHALGLAGPRTDGRLAERIDLGDSDDPKRFLEEWRRTTEDRDHEPPFGVSSRAAGARMRAAVADAARTPTTTALVGHGGATIDLLRDLLGDEVLDARAPDLRTDGVPGGAITLIDMSGDSPDVIAIASLDHIPAPDRTGRRS